MSDKRPDDPAMADILASIRRIVNDEEKNGGRRRIVPAADDEEVLVLTREMLIEEGAKQPDRSAVSAMFGPAQPPRPAPAMLRPAPVPASDPGQDTAPQAGSEAFVSGGPVDDGLVAPAALDLGSDAGLDEAAVADIVRQVLRAEFEGDFGRNLTQQIRRLVHAEVTRALASQGGGGA